MSELVDGLGTDLDGAELRTAFADRDRLDARIALSVATFETAGRYTGDGAVSMRGWLRQETGRDACSAHGHGSMHPTVPPCPTAHGP